MPPKSFDLSKLASFGDVAAEDDAVLDYFLKTDAVNEIGSNEVLLTLGRKGSGKTALVRFFAEESGSLASRSLNLGGYPWNVHGSRIDRGAAKIEAYVSSWKYIIAVELALLSYERTPDKYSPDAKAIKSFAEKNYGSLKPALGDLLAPEKIHMDGTSLEPEILGFKLGSISFSRGSTDMRLGSELNALSESLLKAAVQIAREAGLDTLQLHFDELDQGITVFDEARKEMLTGLILAARDIRQTTKLLNIKLSPIVYLRTDLWDDLTFSDKNKITQTKTLTLEWDSASLLALVNERLQVRLGKGANWDSVATGQNMRGSQTKWNHILNRTFLRPRDVIKFLNFALEGAKRRVKKLNAQHEENEPLVPVILENQDVTYARDAYSRYLKAELDDEIIAHWAQWEEALQACSAISTLTFRREEFTAEYNRRKSPENVLTSSEALKMLYRFSVIGYERRSGYGGASWAFQYTNPEAGWDSAATLFKVHLGLKEYAKLREERAQAGLPVMAPDDFDDDSDFNHLEDLEDLELDDLDDVK
jgi:hypothetical protein